MTTSRRATVTVGIEWVIILLAVLVSPLVPILRARDTHLWVLSIALARLAPYCIVSTFLKLFSVRLKKPPLSMWEYLFQLLVITGALVCGSTLDKLETSLYVSIRLRSSLIG